MKKKLLLLALFAMFSFQSFAQATAYQVTELAQCDSNVFNLTVRNSEVLGNQSPSQFTVSFFLTLASAEDNMNAIANPTAFASTDPDQTVYIRVTNNSNGDFDITPFMIMVVESPLVGDFPDVTSCGSYVLPFIEWPAFYYTAPNGGGTQIAPGTAVTSNQTIYVYATNGLCTDEESFTVTVTGQGVMGISPLMGCDMDGAGTGLFDLGVAMSELTALNPTATAITIHGTLADAQNDTNPFPATMYMNTTVWQDMLYVRIEGTDCTAIIDLQLMVTECATNNSISGHVTFDADNNGCSATDAPAAGIVVFYTSGNSFFSAYTDSNGFYMFQNLPAGPGYATIGANAFTGVATPDVYSFNTPGNTEDVNFCLTTPTAANDVGVYMLPTSAAQPGFAATYALILQNHGTTVANGDVSVQFNDTQLDYMYSAPNMTQTGNTLTYSYSNLQPFETQVIYIQFVVGMPGVVNMGDVITFTSTITPLAGDANASNNTYVLDQVTVNSWDPNDINVREGEFITEAQADGYLHYIVRFQNEGTLAATNVKIQTTLSNHLDAATFEPLASSHNFYTNRNGNNVDIFFDNIQLPFANDNEQGSHGYLIYRVKPASNVAVGDAITAQAGIYFDFNPVVTTNSITTTVMNAAGTKDINAKGFVMYPNPATSKVTLQMQNTNASTIGVTVTDVLGKTVVKTIVAGTQSDLDVSALKSGVYFITLNADGKLATKKLVIE